MKKITCFFIIVCLSLPFSGWASPINVYFDPQASVVNVGDTFIVDIMADISDPVLGWGLDVTFDSTLLTLNRPLTIGTSWNAAQTLDGDGLAGINFFPIFGNNILLATLSFEAIAPGLSDLSLGITEKDVAEGFALITPGQFAGVVFETGSIAIYNTPIPSTMALLGFGLVSLTGVRKKKLKK